MRPDTISDIPSAGFTWGEYIAWLTASHGTLAAVAERLAALRGYTDDAASIERALRRLRARGQTHGGTWGERCLSAFGLPDALSERTRWMGAYHSRFTDLPLPLCADLLRLWDRPPVSEEPRSQVHLALAHATCSLRADDRAGAKEHLARVRPLLSRAASEARAEFVLIEAYIASREDVERVPPLLASVEPLLALPMPEDDRRCLIARWTDQRAFELNREAVDKRPDYAASEALYKAIPTEGAPAFVRSRRESGLAYARWKQGATDVGAAHARASCRHAGDGGHTRMRAMALNLLARIIGGDEGADARRRALAIARELDDEVLRLRFERRLPPRDRASSAAPERSPAHE